MDAKKILEIEAKERTTRAMKKIMVILEEENCTLEPKMVFIGGRDHVDSEVLVMANPIKVTEEIAVEVTPEEQPVETPVEQPVAPEEGGTN